jgi:integrase
MASIQVRKESGCLIVDFYYRGHRCREQTALPDTPANRRKLEKVLAAIEAELASGTFTYRRFFPNSRNAAKFDAPAAGPEDEQGRPPLSNSVGSAPANTPLFRDFAELWFA